MTRAGANAGDDPGRVRASLRDFYRTGRGRRERPGAGSPSSADGQRSLFDAAERERTARGRETARAAEQRTADRFRDWIAANPELWALFIRFARDARRAGRRLSARAIVERIRWEVEIVTSGDSRKINDHWTPHLARKLMAELPAEFAGFFETRGLHSE